MRTRNVNDVGMPLYNIATNCNGTIDASNDCATRK